METLFIYAMDKRDVSIFDTSGDFIQNRTTSRQVFTYANYRRVCGCDVSLTLNTYHM